MKIMHLNWYLKGQSTVLQIRIYLLVASCERVKNLLWIWRSFNNNPNNVTVIQTGLFWFGGTFHRYIYIYTYIYGIAPSGHIRGGLLGWLRGSPPGCYLPLWCLFCCALSCSSQTLRRGPVCFFSLSIFNEIIVFALLSGTWNNLSVIHTPTLYQLFSLLFHRCHLPYTLQPLLQAADIWCILHGEECIQPGESWTQDLPSSKPSGSSVRTAHRALPGKHIF